MSLETAKAAQGNRSLTRAIFSWPNLLNSALRICILISVILKDWSASPFIFGLDVVLQVITWLASTGAITILYSIRYDVSAFVIALFPAVMFLFLVAITVQYWYTTNQNNNTLNH